MADAERLQVVEETLSHHGERLSSLEARARLFEATLERVNAMLLGIQREQRANQASIQAKLDILLDLMQPQAEL